MSTTATLRGPGLQLRDLGQEAGTPLRTEECTATPTADTRPLSATLLQQRSSAVTQTITSARPGAFPNQPCTEARRLLA